MKVLDRLGRNGVHRVDEHPREHGLELNHALNQVVADRAHLLQRRHIQVVLQRHVQRLVLAAHALSAYARRLQVRVLERLHRSKQQLRRRCLRHAQEDRSSESKFSRRPSTYKLSYSYQNSLKCLCFSCK